VSPAFMTAITAAQPIRLLIWEQKRFEELRDKHAKKAEDLRLQLMNAQLNNQVRVAEALRAEYDRETREMSECATGALDKGRAIRTELSSYTKARFAALAPAIKISVRLVSALRVELHLPDDEELFLEMLEATKQKAAKALAETTGIDISSP